MKDVTEEVQVEEASLIKKLKEATPLSDKVIMVLLLSINVQMLVSNFI